MAKALKLEKAVDGHLKPVKDSDDSLTALEVSTDKVRAKNLDVADDLNVEGDIKSPVIDAPATGNLTLSPTNRVILDPHTGGTIYIQDAGTTYATFYTGASHSFLKMFENEGASEVDFLLIGVGANGETTLQTTDAAGATAHLNIEADGHVEFDNCAVGFDLLTPTYNASDTDVSFINGNKQFVTFGAGNITDLNLIFPDTSGNFTLLLKQDGTGSRTVTNYKAWDLVNSDAADGSATVKFAGGSNPTLTTDANHVDIISIFWDADNEIAYGVASLDFQF